MFNPKSFFRYLSPHLYDFLEALITQQTSPEEAYRKFDTIAAKHTEQLRKFTKQVLVSSLSKALLPKDRSAHHLWSANILDLVHGNFFEHMLNLS